MRLLKFSTYSLPRRPYDILDSPFAKRKRAVKPKEELKIENSDELPESESETQQEEKMSDEPTTSSVHEQSLRMAALSLEKKNKKKESVSMESKASN